MKKRGQPCKLLLLMIYVLGPASLMSAHSQLAQNAVAYIQETNVQPYAGQQQKEELRSIPVILSNARKAFDVDFVYETKILPDAKIALKPENYKSVEAFLDELLQPYKLQYKKVLPKVYVIYADNRQLKKLLSALLENNPGSIFQFNVSDTAITPLNGAISVSGKVTDSITHAPLAGASISVKGTSSGTVAGQDGAFSLNVPGKDAVLLISMVGYTTQEIAVGNTRDFQVALSVYAQGLNDIVVVGYGTQKKSVVTGSISSVKASDLENQPINRVDQFLQGRASGLTITAGSGQPGSATTIRIRGTTTLGDSDPLYVVDGVPVDIGGIDYLNPSDIESVEVLKDAASAAIYGARAAAGVILITTKKGKAGRTTMSYNGYYGTQAAAKKLDLLNATQYAYLRNEASVAGGGDIVFDDPASLGKGTDWQSLVFNNDARIQDHEISISGGNEKSTFYTSLGYFDQQGIVASAISNYKRYTARFNGSHKIAGWMNIGTNFGYSHIKSLGIGGLNTEYGGILSSVVNLDPVTPAVVTDPAVIAAAPYAASGANLDGLAIVTDKNGNPYGISSQVLQEMSNPLAYIKTHLGNYGWSDNMVGNAYLEIMPVKGLTLRTNLGAKMAFWGSESFNPYYFYNTVNYNISASSQGLYVESDRALNYTWENTAAYTRAFGGHHLTVLVGTGAYENNLMSRYLNAMYVDLPVNTFAEAKSGHFATATAGTTYAPRGGIGQDYQHKVSSIYGRITYDYAEKYLAQVILRRDGSSSFGKNNKYGYFPSVSLGWVASKENFWPANDVVTFLKIRGSYGENGNDNIGNFSYVSQVATGGNYTFGDNYIYGSYVTAIANPDLKWESTNQTNIGFDAALLKNFTVSFDWYKKRTTGILQTLQVPGYVGVGGPNANIGSMNNTGFEVELGYHKILNKVTFDFKGNVSYLQNKVTNLSPGIEYYTGAKLQSYQLEQTRIQVGRPIGVFYGYKETGIFQNWDQVNNYVNKDGSLIQPNAQPGDFIWADLNGDGEITSDSDRTFIGDPTPNWTFGFTASASYKGFDLVLFCQGVAGNQIYNGLRRLDIPNANYTTKALSRWTEEGTSDTYPRLSTVDNNGNFSNPSDFYLESGAYMRIKLLQIGYSLPASVTERIRLQKIRIYVSGNNLLTLTKYGGYDPEIGGSSYGIDRGFYPQARSFTAGLNITF
ncbi:SusC/RagA family TonB-linked outer membrane protein [Parafilimonas sp.]|uniref:SusC/RagA family TonB-linked outer membrane protein n=1 Tax=Parafilimonas sp. TaxID=1969739 RepID=UPI0039E72392